LELWTINGGFHVATLSNASTVSEFAAPGTRSPEMHARLGSAAERFHLLPMNPRVAMDVSPRMLPLTENESALAPKEATKPQINADERGSANRREERASYLNPRRQPPAPHR